MTDRLPGLGAQALTQPEKLARLRLARSENVGPITFRQLLERYGSGLFTHSPTLPEQSHRSQYVIMPEIDINRH